MVFKSTKIPGCFIIEREPFRDGRGTFSRVFCMDEFARAGIRFTVMQTNISMNKKRGTLRGLHAQKGGHAEDKLVACVHGRVFDVCVDVRENSQTFGGYVGAELSDTNGNMLFIPKGCAHGVLTLEDDCVLLYHMGSPYVSGQDMGFRYNDPAFSIKWPLAEPYILSEKDSNWMYI